MLILWKNKNRIAFLGIVAISMIIGISIMFKESKIRPRTLALRSSSKTSSLSTTSSPMSLVTTSMKPCPKKWTDARSVNLGCLQFYVKPVKDWNSAKAFCKRKYNSFLIEIFNEDQLEFVRRILMKNKLYNIKHWWTGITDEREHGVWIGHQSKKKVENTDDLWEPGQPNDPPNDDGNVVVLDSTALFDWYDNPKTNMWSTICQFFP